MKFNFTRQGNLFNTAFHFHSTAIKGLRSFATALFSYITRSFVRVISATFLMIFTSCLIGEAQCVLPAGAILIESGPLATVDFSTVQTVGAGKVYYVLPGTITSIDHTTKNLTISGGGKIIIMENAILQIQMGGKNMTVNGGIIQICDNGQLLINPGHDFTMNGSSSLITLGRAASMRLCNFGHDVTLNAGTIEMDDYSSIEFGDYHNVVSNATNLVKYIGSGTVGIGSGDPIFHTGGSDFVNYSNTNNIGAPLTNSTHIDFINDNFGSDNPGSAQYCGPRTSPTYATCRLQWGPMAVICGSAAAYQSLLPVRIIEFTSKMENSRVQLYWKTAEEASVNYFTIERSIDNNKFVPINNIFPQQNNMPVHDYSYADNNKPAQNTYYRLKIINRDGSFMYSRVVLVHPENSAENTISCFPNPFVDNFQMITNFSRPEQVRMELFGIDGHLFAKKQFTVGSDNRTTSINSFVDLPKGVYILKITTSDNNYSQRMIKK